MNMTSMKIQRLTLKQTIKEPFRRGIIFSRFHPFEFLLLNVFFSIRARGVVEMGSEPLVEEKKIEETIRNVPKNSFTVLEFIGVFERMYPKEWEMLVERFGLFGSKRRYTVSTYLSNRLYVYSHKPHSILVPFTRWSEGGFKDRRRTTKEEKKFFGSHWISVFKKKDR